MGHIVPLNHSTRTSQKLPQTACKQKGTTVFLLSLIYENGLQAEFDPWFAVKGGQWSATLGAAARSAGIRAQQFLFHKVKAVCD